MNAARLAAAGMLLFGLLSYGATPELKIALVTPDQRETRQLLQKLLREYDLSDYLFTHEITIQSGAIPHSHPVLTLDTRYRNKHDELLSNFLHEQIHWFMTRQDFSRTDAAFRQLRKLYPKVPVGFPDGAQSEESTYLHLAVCWLELQADRRFLGKERAERVLGSPDVYRWIYRTVLRDDEKIGRIMKAHGLVIERKRD